MTTTDAELKVCLHTTVSSMLLLQDAEGREIKSISFQGRLIPAPPFFVIDNKTYRNYGETVSYSSETDHLVMVVQLRQVELDRAEGI